ncbi:MAG: aminotransferase class I/II-fold pyridoxal phosphate-dependent enzyme [Lachnospiraceae bacterium]|nr:aminotransferase class I/II-fold pyridoxal phosphate-dependent enzyme [Lachnospiraceae bacterium]
MIPLAVPNLRGNEKKYVDHCIETEFVSSVGAYVTQMEEMCREACGADDAVATSSGTTGLHAMLYAFGVRRDDIVILPTFTFIASANAVAHCGAEPWLFDIDENWVLDATAVEEALQTACRVTGEGTVIHTATGRRVAAIMPVYTLGNIPDMNRFRKIADKYRLPLLADAACAVGATFENRPIGALSDAAVLSFNGNKTITCGGGGMVIGNDKERMKLIRHITTTARVGIEYDFDMVGFNYRMTNVQAAIGCAQMEQLDTFIKRKKAVHRFYETHISGTGDIAHFPVTDGGTCWYSGIVFRDGGIEKVRKTCANLKERGVESRTFWKPVHLQTPYVNAPRQQLTRAEQIWENIVSLPCSTCITDDELETVAAAVNDLCG